QTGRSQRGRFPEPMVIARAEPPAGYADELLRAPEPHSLREARGEVVTATANNPLPELRRADAQGALGAQPLAAHGVAPAALGDVKLLKSEVIRLIVTIDDLRPGHLRRCCQQLLTHIFRHFLLLY